MNWDVDKQTGGELCSYKIIPTYFSSTIEKAVQREPLNNTAGTSEWSSKKNVQVIHRKTQTIKHKNEKAENKK